MTNRMNFDVDSTVPMKTVHCFLWSKALHQGPHRLAVQFDLQARGLGTNEIKFVCRYNSLGVQIQMRYGVITCVEELGQHINMSTLTESLNPSFHLCFVLYDIYTELFKRKQHIFTLKLLSHLKPAGLLNLSMLELSIQKFRITM